MTHRPPSNDAFRQLLIKSLEGGNLDRFLQNSFATYPDLLDPEDFRQSVISRALANESAFRGTTLNELFGWLRSVARTVVVDAWRRLQRQPKANQAVMSTKRSLTIDPYTVIETKDLLTWMLGGLSESELSIVKMRDFEEKTFDEIAEQIGSSRQAAIQRHYRARQKLRNLVKKLSFEALVSD